MTSAVWRRCCRTCRHERRELSHAVLLSAPFFARHCLGVYVHAPSMPCHFKHPILRPHTSVTSSMGCTSGSQTRDLVSCSSSAVAATRPLAAWLRVLLRFRDPASVRMESGVSAVTCWGLKEIEGCFQCVNSLIHTLFLRARCCSDTIHIATCLLLSHVLMQVEELLFMDCFVARGCRLTLSRVPPSSQLLAFAICSVNDDRDDAP